MIRHKFLKGGKYSLKENKLGISRHIAGQKPFVAIDIVDQAVIEISPEPFLR